MIVAIVIVIAEYIVCKTCDSAIYIAITSEICGLIKIVIFMRIIANYAQRKISDLIPLKLIGGGWLLYQYLPHYHRSFYLIRLN